MKVTTASFGQFHTFNQAVELERHHLLFEFFNNYPKSIAVNAGIAPEHIKTLLYTGVIHRFYKKAGWKSLAKYLHKKFSLQVASQLNMETDIVIGLSSFNFEVIKKLNNTDIITVTDHGSVHLKTMQQTLNEEIEKFGLHDYYRTPAWSLEAEEYEFENSDYIFLGSEYAKETFLEQGYPAKKLIINNLGVDLTSFRKVKKLDNKFRIIYCGGIKVSKGVHYLIKAFNELNLKNAELWLIGAGFPNADFSKVCKVMDLKFDNVVFKGPFPQKELYKLFSQGDVFCMPSLSDGFGLVVPQAMACGLPVIVTENTGAKDIVHNENGFIVPIRDVEALKFKILKLYEDHELLKWMSHNAYDKNNLEKISWKSYGERLLKNLQNIMETKNGSN